MAEILEHPLAERRRTTREQALLCYRLLTEQVELLERKWGRWVGGAAAVQLRLLLTLWHALNTQLGNGWIEADPEWEALRQRFTAVTSQAEPPNRQPSYREARAQIGYWELSHGPLLLLHRAAQNIPA
ncbi:MAG: hypothetical protein INF43_01285 [Alphaproteobacteria bacterium]|nr:hypothetical protein [Alphaproteobacteria bacterium]